MARSPVSPAGPAATSPAGDRIHSGSAAAHVLRSLRPGQWTKNLLVFAGLIFSQKLLQPDAALKAAVAFVVFCLLSGVVYVVNDVRDRESDRRHPVKSRRPIASGQLPVGAAIGAAVVLAAVALSAAVTVNHEFALVALGYLVLMLTYSATLKHVVILDVLTIAAGFVLRAIGGAVAIDVPFSEWLVLLTLLLALFLALSKRRAELVALAADAKNHRRILDEYSPYLLDQMISVVTASTLLAYAFYTISPDTVQRFGTHHLLYTVPFPLYGIFRYLYLVHQRAGGADPADALLTDRPLLACVALWAGVVIFILYGPGR